MSNTEARIAMDTGKSLQVFKISLIHDINSSAINELYSDLHRIKNK